jgi:hypothetical protein
MNLQEIKTWLDNPNREYAIGLSIYNDYKPSRKFDDFFNVQNPHPESMQFKMLTQRVREIYRKIQQSPGLLKADPITVKPINIDDLKKKSGQRVNPLGSDRPRIVTNPLVEVSQLPEELQQSYFENKNLTREIGVLHTELKAVPKDSKFNDKRKALAETITKKDDARAENWEKIDIWWKGNKLATDQQKQDFDDKKEELKVSIQEAKIIFNRIDSLKINITREEKRMKSNPLLAEKLSGKVIEWKKELTELEEKVK